MSFQTTAGIPRLRYLAEFRYQLRKFLSFSESTAERYGVAAQQYQLMQVVGAIPPSERASISYIAERMILRPNSTVELVDRAERAGLVKRDVDEDDLRRSIVVLTPKGCEVLESMVNEHLRELESMGNRIVDALTHLNSTAFEPAEEVDVLQEDVAEIQP